MSELEIDLRSNLIQCLTGIAPSSSTQHRLECALTHPPPLRFKKKKKNRKEHTQDQDWTLRHLTGRSL